MIRKLRLKFILTITGILIAVFLIVLATLNVFMRVNSFRDTERFLKSIVERDGFYGVPKNPPPNANKNSQHILDGPQPGFFYVKLDGNNTLIEMNTEMILDKSEEDVRSYVEIVLAEEGASGKIDDFQYLSEKKDYGTMIAFAERKEQNELLQQLMEVSLLVVGVSSIVLLGMSILLSKIMIAPVQKAFEKQQQFISDASHELKTPLAIMNTNTDVLENEIGKNNRLEQIRGQIGRMDELIKNLLSLTRMDEVQAETPMNLFSLSTLLLNTTLEFESQAFEEDRVLKYNIPPSINYFGVESQIKQVIAILIDNAIRYSQPCSTIYIDLEENDDKILFSVFNNGNGIKKEEIKKIFDRFYRSDQSRSRDTGGYGLGLAIANEIVSKYKSKIVVESKVGEWTRFTVLLNK